MLRNLAKLSANQTLSETSRNHDSLFAGFAARDQPEFSSGQSSNNVRIFLSYSTIKAAIRDALLPSPCSLRACPESAGWSLDLKRRGSRLQILKWLLARREPSHPLVLQGRDP